ncbi:hypothetical protein AVEN_190218-1 [Araneus ventricosus]|uniref:Uncharacterized protein n=1 Tax=Araneus ventricosus TaxID=182803 RepID=A0A4Y2FFI4_ARAVE|nr:hypothetical protein AVEN_190218-1 [Araneus ventricosus]
MTPNSNRRSVQSKKPEPTKCVEKKKRMLQRENARRRRKKATSGMDQGMQGHVAQNTPLFSHCRAGREELFVMSQKLAGSSAATCNFGHQRYYLLLLPTRR